MPNFYDSSMQLTSFHFLEGLEVHTHVHIPYTHFHAQVMCVVQYFTCSTYGSVQFTLLVFGLKMKYNTTITYIHT